MSRAAAPKYTGARRWAAAGLLLIGLLAAAAPVRALDRVSLGLVWVHQAQFAGTYVAQDQGLYRQYGLEVRVLAGGPHIDSLRELAQGRCQFVVAPLAAAMVRRAKGLELVHLAQVVRRSAHLLVARAASGITSLADLDGRRVSLWGGISSLAALALFKRQGLKVRAIPQGTTMDLLLSRAVDAASAMRYNEYHQLYQAGLDFRDLVVFDLAKLGLNFPEDGIYTMESTWRQSPDLCRRLVAATMAGWQRAFENPQAALDSVMRRVRQARLATNRSHQRWMLGVMRRIVMEPRDQAGSMGRLDPRAFALVGRVLQEHGFIKSPPAMEAMVVGTGRKRP